MIVVGELINTSRKAIEGVVREKDAAFIPCIAKNQADAGADHIDVNAGTFLENEAECLRWLVETIQPGWPMGTSSSIRWFNLFSWISAWDRQYWRPWPPYAIGIPM